MNPVLEGLLLVFQSYSMHNLMVCVPSQYLSSASLEMWNVDQLQLF